MPIAYGSRGEESYVTADSRSEQRPTPVQNYLSSLVFIGLFPLAPLVVEWVTKNGMITEESLVITAAIYTLVVALASNNGFYFSLGIVVSFIEAAAYGSVVSMNSGNHHTARFMHVVTLYSNGSVSSLHTWPFFAMVLPFLSLIIERRTRHVENREVYFEFLKGGGG
jgi:hypothetical protein